MKNSVSKAEIQEIAEILTIFNSIPEPERTAVKYYLKGRLDAEQGNIEIPVEFARRTGAVVVAPCCGVEVKTVDLSKLTAEQVS